MVKINRVQLVMEVDEEYDDISIEDLASGEGIAHLALFLRAKDS